MVITIRVCNYEGGGTGGYCPDDGAVFFFHPRSNGPLRRTEDSWFKYTRRNLKGPWDWRDCEMTALRDGNGNIWGIDLLIESLP